MAVQFNYSVRCLLTGTIATFEVSTEAQNKSHLADNRENNGWTLAAIYVAEIHNANKLSTTEKPSINTV